jgi:tetratricopeptide (TPR) repeat protein
MTSSKSKHQLYAAWIFGAAIFLILAWAFLWGPDELPPHKHRILQFFSAALAGFFGFFFTGEVMLKVTGNMPKGWKMAIQAGGGMALFVLVFLFWQSPLSPIRSIEEIRKYTKDALGNTEEIKGDTRRIVQLLEGELRIKNQQIAFLQGQLDNLPAPMPSDRARELAKQIPDDANSYALALKAVAQRDFEKARRLLAIARQKEETDLSRIYQTAGDMEMYAGRYKEAAEWYDKALALSPGNSGLLSAAGKAYYYMAQWQKSEPLLRRALAIDEKSYGPDHPKVAVRLNNLAVLLWSTNQLAESELLVRHALAINEQSYGPVHPNVATNLNNLALLLKATNRPEEADTLMRRAVDIFEKAYGKDHPDVAASMSNLATFLQDRNLPTEAEPLLRRALAIDVKSYGPDHPIVAIRLNNLAALLRDTNRLAEAESLQRQALEIWRASYGPDHPHTQTARKNLAIMIEEMAKK